MKPRIVVVIAVAVAALLGWWWWSRAVAPAPLARPSAVVPAPPPIAASEPDPRTLARGSIAGTIRDEAGAPIAGARVCATPASDGLPAELLDVATCAVTGGDGGYVVAGLVAADYAVSAGAAGRRPATFHTPGAHHEGGVTLAAGQARGGIDLILRAGGVEVTGVVSDIGGGPIVGAAVTASPYTMDEDGDLDEAPAVLTDTSGGFRLWVAPGAVFVTAEASGYVVEGKVVSAPGRVALRLTPAASLSGTVVDARTGAAIAGAAVQVAIADGELGSGGSDLTDGDGRFRVHGLPPGRYAATAQTSSGHGESDGAILVGLGHPVAGLVIRLFPATSVRGRVVVAGAPPRPCPEPLVHLRDPARGRGASGRDLPDGGARFDGMLPGTYQVSVECRGFVAHASYPPVVVGAREVTGLIWEVDPGATLRGTVRERGGAAVAGARVEASSVGGASPQAQDDAAARTGADGRYELHGLRGGRYELSVDSPRGGLAADGVTVEVAAGASSSRDLIVEGVGAIEGVVVEADGRPVDDAVVVPVGLTAATTSRYLRQPTDAAGRFRIEGLAPGAYSLGADDEAGATLRRPGTSDDDRQGVKVVVRVGQVASARLVVESRRGVIKGAVVDAAGAGIGDAFVEARRESEAADGRRGAAAGAPALSSPDGTFALTGLADGAYTLRAFRRGGGEVTAAHVAVGATVRLSLRPTAQLAGTARFGDDAAPQALTVEVVDPASGVARSEMFFHTDGRFAILDLPAGRYALTVRGDGGGEARVAVELAEGEARRDLAVTLATLITITGRVVDLQTRTPVAGVSVTAAALGAGGPLWNVVHGGDLPEITDADGRFTVTGVPPGPIALGGLPREGDRATHGAFTAARIVAGPGPVDVGDLPAVRVRLAPGERPGDLGLSFKDPPPGQPIDQARLEIRQLDPRGPCAQVGLRVGDVITTIDGVDVTGAGTPYATTLWGAPAGTRLTIQVARGPTVEVVLAGP